MSPFCNMVWTCQPFLVVYKRDVLAVYTMFNQGGYKNDKRSKGGCLWNAFGCDKETDSNKNDKCLLLSSDDWYSHVTHCFGWRFHWSHFGLPDWARGWVVSRKMRSFKFRLDALLACFSLCCPYGSKVSPKKILYPPKLYPKCIPSSGSLDP